MSNPLSIPHLMKQIKVEVGEKYQCNNSAIQYDMIEVYEFIMIVC